jgi:hypothetical protein
VFIFISWCCFFFFFKILIHWILLLWEWFQIVILSP